MPSRGSKEVDSFALRLTEHWNRVPRELVDSRSQEILKIHLNSLLCFRQTCFSSDLFQPLPFCDASETQLDVGLSSLDLLILF